MKHFIPFVFIFLNQFIYSQNNTNRKPLTIDGSEFESIEVSKIKAEREKFVYDSIAKSESELMELEVVKAMKIQDSIANSVVEEIVIPYEEPKMEDESNFTSSDWEFVIKTYPDGENLKIISEAIAIMGWKTDEITYEKCLAALPMFKKANITMGLNYHQMAFCEYVLQKYEDAIYDFTKAINLTPNKYFESDALIKSKGSIEKLIFISYRLNTDDAFYFRAICKQELKDHRGAISDLDKIEAKYTKNEEFYLKRGISKYYLEKYAEAKLDFTKSLQIEKSGVAYFGRGVCNIFLGLKESGCLDLSKAGELGHEKAYEAIKEYCNK